MDTPAPVALSVAPAAPALATGLAGWLRGLDRRAHIALGAGALLLAAALAVTLQAGSQPSWRVLYANLGDKDGGQVIAALTQMNVPHRFTEGGAAILVPEPQVHEARLKLAAQGLPRGGTVGFELMENQKFGTTQFQERLNFQRGLEGELARSIMAMPAVQGARVHLALPQATAFLREQQKPSASVLLSLHPGRSLDRAQVAGIVHLVASSVPDLQPRAVSVVDHSGQLLSQPADGAGGLNAGQLDHVRQTELLLASRVIAIVEPLVGPGNVKAQVTADIDFSQSESKAETYAPNQGQAAAAVRSQHLTEAPGAGPAAAGGIPGALSNQPAASAASPVNGAAQTLAAAPAAGGAAGARRDAVTNYEVDHTVKVVRNASGEIRRLSAAVVVNGAATVPAAGGASAPAITPAQLQQIEALVREAMGFRKERGDSLSISDAPFRMVQMPTPEPLPLWREPEVQALARGMVPWMAMAVVALVFVLGIVRPALRASQRRVPEPAARLVDARVDGPVDLPAAARPASLGAATATGSADPVPLLPTAEAAVQQARSRQLDGIRDLARQNPATVANVVRNWASQSG